jgi:hypothetical protein
LAAASEAVALKIPRFGIWEHDEKVRVEVVPSVRPF